MEQEKYSLTWQTYSAHLKNMMEQLMRNNDFADVTLVSNDKKQMKAHKNILSACSPVFQDILQYEKNSISTVFLKDINYSELESIIQFIYLGEATFHQEHMNDFLNVSRSLDIKGLCNADTKTETNNVNVETVSNTSNESCNEDNLQIRDSPEPRNKPDELKAETHVDKYKCKQCDKVLASKSSLNTHKKGQHSGIKFSCSKCNYQSNYQASLTMHFETIHNGKQKLNCDKCNFQTVLKGNLKQHIEAKHEGIKYKCEFCDLEASLPGNLKRHIQVMHKDAAC